MDVLKSTLEDHSLYELALSAINKDVDVVQGEMTGETYVVTEDRATALHREETAVDGAIELATCTPNVGHLYEDGSLSNEERQFGLLFSPAELEKMDLIRELNNGIDFVRSVEDGYRYIDGFTSGGGLIFGPNDWHWDGSVLVSTVMAEENSEEYLKRLQNQYFTRVCDCLLDRDQLSELGFVPFDKRVHSEDRMQYGKVPRGQSRSETYEYISTHYPVSDVVFRNSWEVFVRFNDSRDTKIGDSLWDRVKVEPERLQMDGPNL
jgi:hypothetical protein